MRTIALIKQVPKGEITGALDADGRLRRDGLELEINPFCRRAVALAVRVARDAGGESTVLTMGPPGADDVLREALACGAHAAVHICDPDLAGSDCLVTARALAAAVRAAGPADLILVGRNSVDADTGAVGPMLAERLGLPFAGPVLELDVADGEVRAKLQQAGASEHVRSALPAVVAVAERPISPAKAAPETWPDGAAVRRLTVADLGGGPWGLAGSPTLVSGLRTAAPLRTPTLFAADEIGAAVGALIERGALYGAAPVAAEPVPAPHPLPRRVLLVAVGEHVDDSGRFLLAAAAGLAGPAAARVVAIAPAGCAGELARWGADEVLAPDRWAPAPLAAALSGEACWALLAPATDWGRELAARLAARREAGLLTDLVAVGVDGAPDGAPGGRPGGPQLVGNKPAGHGHLAEVRSRGLPQLATIRTGTLPAALPRTAGTAPVRTLAVSADERVRRLARHADDDYDRLDRADVVLGVGRGVDPADYPLLEPLRRLLDAELAATRPVTDAGNLPHARQVGLTARTIAPRLYVALGISGRPNHLAGIARAGHVLAVNTDPSAPIFDHCDVGIVADWRAALPGLLDALGARSPARLSRL